MVRLINVKNNNTYYQKLKVGITMSVIWNSLQTKSEIGLNKSEKGYQRIAKSMAENIAIGLNLNSDLAQCLTMCYGSFFPAYGSEGKKVVMQFLKENNINMTESELAKNYIEYQLDREGNLISPKFDQYLTELFDDSKTGSILEVEVAKLCGNTMNSIKKIEMNSNITPEKLLNNITKDIEKECIENGKIIQSKKLEELLSLIPKEKTRLTDDIRKIIYNDLNEFIEYEKENDKAIYEYIGTNER